MKNLIHVHYGKLKEDILRGKLGDSYQLCEPENDEFKPFIIKNIYSDTTHRFVALYIYSYNDLMIDDHSSYETDLWNIRQCTPFDMITLAPELVPYLTDNVDQVTALTNQV